MLRSPSFILSFAFLAMGCATGPAAQAAQNPTGEGQALAQHHPDLHALLDRIEIAHRILYERMATEMPEIEVPDAPEHGGHGAHAEHAPDPSHADHADHADHAMDHGAMAANPFDDETYQELADLIRAGGHEAHDRAPMTEGALSPRLNEIIRRTHVLHRRILEAYADAEIDDPRSTAEAAIDEYLGEPELALAAEPKSMDLMHDHIYSTAFRRTHPKLSGLIWASHWLQLAAYDPFFQRATPEERAAGIATVIGRLAGKLEDPPAGFPTQLPMAPTIAPSLLHWHPRAAAIFDNLHMLHEVVADLLVHPDVVDKRAEIDEVVEQFTNSEHRLVTRSDWLRMALRHGIYNQGGPALGTLTRSERNVEIGDHDHHGQHIILPGMP